MSTPDRTVAGRLAGLVGEVFGGRVPVRIRAWDGSEAGPADDAPVVVLRSRTALRRLLWDPNELGLARAYVAGEIDVEGDLAEGLSRVWSLVRERPPALPGVRDQLRWARTAVRLGIVGRRPAAPPEEAVLSGEKHTTDRDSDAISYHYDQSNDVYQALLDEHMAYSCAYFREDPATDPGAADGSYTVTEAQRDKLELVCRKLGLQPGMRLLDVGCGWGSMIVYAAQHHGVHATGVTISAQQRDHIEKVVAERGLADRVTVRLQDYRDVPVPVEGPYDAISSIEMSEHVGQEQYPVYAATLHRLVRPGGRVLVQAMSHPSAPGGGAFIERYVAPDMHMRPTWQTAEMLAAPGLELRDVESIREHYDWTVRAWAQRLEERWDEVAGLIGTAGARIWRLYLAGGGLTFAENRMGVDQLLFVKPRPDGRSGMPATRSAWHEGLGAPRRAS
ncbi:SAM-dependent methyltransferase [Klenkia taihuensis]|uniref:Cyclopropane-fatty-acyl-phospholipid synthase n=1 Tax=Klenkia taihuensis TaxID=1225127 RepID=A0A1I1JKH8_9ACTN|nr:cyclopropane-fatty-acyl-phospholipid synthase family protein [Klenkia taihuensis]GHE10937.1 cyclopropane-fatty-acyl-phospholipid synthase [Klenkia taihuensis]SFC47068.1 cyclopropane-fatty-acyl-phospholipid synthase [Klenkia taihuensis]